MKGVMSFLEKTGFIQATGDGAADAAVQEIAIPAEVMTAPAEPAAPVSESTAMSLDQIYQAAGVPASNFPAEKMLRLMDGLRVMDEATRRQAVQAMDAADDTWTIQDPIADAVAKIQALTTHAKSLRAGMEQAEAAGQAEIEVIGRAEAESVASIRQQMAELEAMLQRRVAVAAEEKAQIQARVQAEREGALLAVEKVNAAANDLRRLITEFGSVATPSKTASA